MKLKEKRIYLTLMSGYHYVAQEFNKKTVENQGEPRKNVVASY